jgi:hypothetical protein
VDRGYALESMADQPLYAALMSPGPALHSLEMIEAFRDLAGFGVMLIDTPQPNNRVVLDESGSPRIDYKLSEADKKRFSKGIAEAIRVMFKAGAKEVYLPTTEDILGDGTDQPKPGAETGVQPQVLTSPDQAALVEKIRDACAQLGLEYSTWIDDLAFSGDKARDVIQVVVGVLKRIGLRLSHKKIKIMGGTESKLLTGTRFGDHSLRAPKELCDRARAGIHNLECGLVPESEKASYCRKLSALIAHIGRISPKDTVRIQSALSAKTGSQVQK